MLTGGCLLSPGNAVWCGGHLQQGLCPAPGSVSDHGRDCKPPAQCQKCGCVRGLLQLGEGKSQRSADARVCCGRDARFMVRTQPSVGVCVSVLLLDVCTCLTLAVLGSEETTNFSRPRAEVRACGSHFTLLLLSSTPKEDTLRVGSTCMILLFGVEFIF